MLSFLCKIIIGGIFSKAEKAKNICNAYYLLFSNKHAVFKNSWSHWQEKKKQTVQTFRVRSKAQV